MTLENRVVFITGASRGVGRACALAAARAGADIVIAAKTTTPHPKLPGTIYTTAKEVEALGRRALPIPRDAPVTIATLPVRGRCASTGSTLRPRP